VDSAFSVSRAALESSLAGSTDAFEMRRIECHQLHGT
jgi:hypothetical protein